MLLLKIAFRNIFRQKRRSILTGLTMVVGFVLMLISLSVQEGMYGSMIDLFTKTHTGHVQLHKKGYLDKPSPYKTLPQSDQLLKTVNNYPDVKSSTYRVYGAALAFIDKKTTGVKVIGIDPKVENRTTEISKKIEKGGYFSKFDPEGDYEIVLGNKVAKILKAEIGSKLALVSQGVDGSMANELFTVVGILSKDSDSSERNNCYIDIKAAQEYFVLEGKIHEIIVVLKNYSLSKTVSEKLGKKLIKKYPEIETTPWEKVEEQFYKSMEADKKGNYIMLFIIILIVSIGVLNTVLMAILERTREFGVLKAIGTKGRDIFFIILFESVFLSIIAVTIGSILGTGVNYYLATIGIKYPEPISIGGIYVEEMFGQFSIFIYLIPALVVMLSSFFVTIFPALRASKIVPVKAMRSV